MVKGQLLDLFHVYENAAPVLLLAKWRGCILETSKRELCTVSTKYAEESYVSHDEVITSQISFIKFHKDSSKLTAAIVVQRALIEALMLHFSPIFLLLLPLKEPRTQMWHYMSVSFAGACCGPSHVKSIEGLLKGQWGVVLDLFSGLLYYTASVGPFVPFQTATASSKTSPASLNTHTGSMHYLHKFGPGFIPAREHSPTPADQQQNPGFVPEEGTWVDMGHLFRTFHLHMTGLKCNANGTFIDWDAPPSPHMDAPPTDWTPYNNWVESC
ncbi:uncharacterized protein EDB91DRAFT_1080074 [Suillus paluster]|uniref:uncharacterized protein n=1 Tax=Suillus paluster TaxID=48578 RepID=UPI001B85B6FD|nr:uncharacterized protein EDB91DRAFT_1080074 [Suillus paluster]KAG1745807.1 hypothetical protein EDB91DRAFT_1080074 [Suillus paluster]